MSDTYTRKGDTGEPTTNVGEFGHKKQDEASASTLERVTPGLTNIGKKLRGPFDSKEDKVNLALEELDKGIEALASDEGWIKGLNTMSKFNNYSFNNQVLIWIQKSDATRVAGFNTWKAVGRNVIKGEKALTVLAPVTRTFSEKDDAGNPVLDEDGKPKRHSAVVGFTAVPTFDISQTEGDPLPDLQPNLTETPPEGLIDDLEAAIKAEGWEVSYGNTGDPERKGYTTVGGKVVISEDLSPASRAKTLAHELGHIKMGHLERMGEYHTGAGGCRGEMEVEAESFAYVMSRMNGMSTDLSQNTSRYLNSWSGKGKVDEEGLKSTAAALKKSGENIRKAVVSTTEAHSFRNIARDPLEAGREKAAAESKERAAARRAKKRTAKKSVSRRVSA